MGITENMMTTSYNKNLQRNISNLVSSNLKPAPQRQYNHVSEDPVTASKAFATRDQIARIKKHTSVVKNAAGELETADSSILTLNSILENIYEKATKTGGTSNQDSLDAIAKELNDQMEEILQTMNVRYGDKFLFSGSANSKAPFPLDADGNLLFNGRQVDAYDKNDPDMYFTENEPVYPDVGFGTYASGMNTTKPGIKISTSSVDVLGYGKDENEYPNNLYSLVDQVSGQLKAGDKNDIMDTLAQLKKKQSDISITTSEIGTREKMLERTQNRLETGPASLQKIQEDLEAVKAETEAVTNKSAGTAWMVTLQLGSSIIPPSIFDFME